MRFKKMKCPYCASAESKVIDKRETENEEMTRRRRECLSCSKRFTTYETIELAPIQVIKKDSTRQTFDKPKLVSGIMKSCEKRPITLEQIQRLVNEVELEIRQEGNNEIKSKDIGEIVMKKLKSIDEVAYIRFASVYREFTDLTSFEQELKQLLKKRSKKMGEENV